MFKKSNVPDVPKKLVYDGPGKYCNNVKVYVEEHTPEEVAKFKARTNEILDEMYREMLIKKQSTL